MLPVDSEIDSGLLVPAGSTPVSYISLDKRPMMQPGDTWIVKERARTVTLYGCVCGVIPQKGCRDVTLSLGDLVMFLGFIKCKCTEPLPAADAAPPIAIYVTPEGIVAEHFWTMSDIKYEKWWSSFTTYLERVR